MATTESFSREELLKYFAEAFNVARRHISSPGTKDLEVEDWEVWFLQVEEKIKVDIAEGIKSVEELKKYFEKLAIQWANEAFKSSWQEILNYKK